MQTNQEPKYDVRGDRVINRATGEAIPDDEPIFIIRAKDVNAVEALNCYAQICGWDTLQFDAVKKRIEDFKCFRDAYPERMKQLDTEAAKLRSTKVNAGYIVTDDEPTRCIHGVQLMPPGHGKSCSMCFDVLNRDVRSDEVTLPRELLDQLFHHHESSKFAEGLKAIREKLCDAEQILPIDVENEYIRAIIKRDNQPPYYNLRNIVRLIAHDARAR